MFVQTIAMSMPSPSLFQSVRIGSEPMAEAESRVAGNRPLAEENLADAVVWG